MEKAALWEARHFLFHSLVDTFQGLEIRFTKVNTLPNVQQLVDVKYYSTAGSSNTNWISHLLYSSQTTTITGESYSCCFGRFSHSIPSTRLPPQFSSPSHTVPRGGGKKKKKHPMHVAPCLREMCQPDSLPNMVFPRPGNLLCNVFSMKETCNETLSVPLLFFDMDEVFTRDEGVSQSRRFECYAWDTGAVADIADVLATHCIYGTLR